MSPRTFVLFLLGTALASGCGSEPPSSSGSRLALDVTLERAVADELGAFQVVVLPNGRSRSCLELQRTCLNQQVKLEEALELRSPQEQGRALRFPVRLQGGIQELAVDIPVGRDYAVIIEALSRHTPPRFLGSSCTYLEAVNATRNEPLLAVPITLTGGECDPTFPP